MVPLDRGEIVDIIDHQRCRVGDAVLGDVAAPVQRADLCPVAEMKARDRIARQVAALGMQQVGGTGALQRQFDGSGRFRIIDPAWRVKAGEQRVVDPARMDVVVDLLT